MLCILTALSSPFHRTFRGEQSYQCKSTCLPQGSSPTNMAGILAPAIPATAMVQYSVSTALPVPFSLLKRQAGSENPTAPNGSLEI